MVSISPEASVEQVRVFSGTRLVAVSVVFLLVFLTPGLAQASGFPETDNGHTTANTRRGWETVDQDTGFRSAYTRGRTRNYLRVQFFAGLPSSGASGTFEATWRIRCRGGLRFIDSRVVHDYPQRYWTIVMRIPRGQGWCIEDIGVQTRHPRQARITAGIQIKSR